MSTRIEVDCNSANDNLSIEKNIKRYGRMPNYVYDYWPNVLAAKHMTLGGDVMMYQSVFA